MPLQIRPMTRDDLPLGMRLKQQAGWNQLEADWLRFLDMQPNGCFVACLDRVPVATTVTCIFGQIAWVAMVLVDAAVRGRGIGTALVRHALEYLDSQSVRSARLDATPLGQPVYQQFGFRAQYSLGRFTGRLPHAAHMVPVAGENDAGYSIVTPVVADDWTPIIELDRQVTGTDRDKFLRRLYSEQPHDFRVVKREGRIAAYLAARSGGRALQVGPCVALPADGAALLGDFACRREGQRAILDIPLGNRDAVAIVAPWGWDFQRELTRMIRGTPVHEDRSRLFASSGPELG